MIFWDIRQKLYKNEEVISQRNLIRESVWTTLAGFHYTGVWLSAQMFHM